MSKGKVVRSVRYFDGIQYVERYAVQVEGSGYMVVDRFSDDEEYGVSIKSGRNTRQYVFSKSQMEELLDSVDQ